MTLEDIWSRTTVLMAGGGGSDYFEQVCFGYHTVHSSCLEVTLSRVSEVHMYR